MTQAFLLTRLIQELQHQLALATNPTKPDCENFNQERLDKIYNLSNAVKLASDTLNPLKNDQMVSIALAHDLY